MNYIGLNTCDTANGPGVRVSLFVSGCTLHCRGCFNSESWDFNAGRPFTDETLTTLLKYLEEPFVQGLSLLGGDPFEPENLPTVTAICRAVRKKFGSTRDIWCWTGRKYEKIADAKLFEYIDTLVDGPFIERLKVQTKGDYFGSSNQRVIPIVKNTLSDK